MPAELMVDETSRKPTKSGPWQAAKTVFFAFFGVRRRDDHESLQLTPVQIIVAGLIGAALFVFSILMLVHFVTS